MERKIIECFSPPPICTFYQHGLKSNWISITQYLFFKGKKKTYKTLFNGNYISWGQKSVPSQNKETEIKTEEIYGERFVDDINMEASWLVAHTQCHSVSSVTQSCPTLCDPMSRSTPGLPVQHQLPGFTQTHAHRVSDAIQPSHPLSSPSPPAPNLSQRQGLFQWVNSSHEVAKVLAFQHTLTKWVQTPALPLTSTVTLGNKVP